MDAGADGLVLSSSGSSNLIFADDADNALLTIVDTGEGARLEVRCQVLGDQCLCGAADNPIVTICTMVTPAPSLLPASSSCPAAAAYPAASGLLSRLVLLLLLGIAFALWRYRQARA